MGRSTLCQEILEKQIILTKIVNRLWLYIVPAEYIGIQYIEDNIPTFLRW